jgi:hypothetical protein
MPRSAFSIGFNDMTEYVLTESLGQIKQQPQTLRTLKWNVRIEAYVIVKKVEYIPLHPISYQRYIKTYRNRGSFVQIII